jgi:cytochrome c oxidase accessory protein FixG
MLSARPVEGAFRRLRWAADAILIAILFGIPWLRLRGEPLVLLDVPGRKFHVFGLTLFPQELYFLWLILAGLALALFFFTAIAGRLWCGWACPQTVFTDVFAAVARRIQGWTAGGAPRHVAVWRRAATHAVWVGLSLLIGFHLVAYFRSPYELLGGLRAGRLSGPVLGFWAAASALSWFDFGVVRQTFCKYLCPYARFQSVLFDRDTLVVAYEPRRGEPRGKKGTVEGDCVDCGLCVEVCPTGIDIRNGLQLECIACTQCIDACNGVMARVGRPRNLIGYRSLAALEGRRTRLARPRVAVYGALLLAAGLAFGELLALRKPLELQVLHNSALFQRTADGRVGNAYTLHVQNRDRTQRVFRLNLEPHEEYELVTGMNPLLVPPTTTLETGVFVVARDPEIHDGGGRRVTFVLEELEHPDRRIRRASPFVAPGRQEEQDDDD